MRLFVTGSTGFIGSYFIAKCLDLNYSVLALLRPGGSSASNSVLPPQKIDWITKDICDVKATDLTNVDAIVHLAATGVSPRLASWRQLRAVNIDATMHLCAISLELGLPIVLAGSYAEYGLSALDYLAIPVTAPLRPTFPYAASKAAAYQLVSGFARSEGLAVGYLRIFNAYGDGQHHSNLWPSLRQAALSGNDFDLTPGQQIRDFIHVNDVASSFADVLKLSLLQPGCTYVQNIGTGVPTAIRDFCSHWWSAFQARGQLRIGALPYRDNEVMQYVPCLDANYI